MMQRCAFCAVGAVWTHAAFNIAHFRGSDLCPSEPKGGQDHSAFATHFVLKDGIVSMAQMVKWSSSHWKIPVSLPEPEVYLLKSP